MLAMPSEELSDLAAELSELGFFLGIRRGIKETELVERLRTAALWILDSIGEPPTLPLLESPVPIEEEPHA